MEYLNATLAQFISLRRAHSLSKHMSTEQASDDVMIVHDMLLARSNSHNGMHD